jgi:hypothetical protein
VELDPDEEIILEDIVEELENATGVTKRKAEALADSYRNLTTLYWATWHDRMYLQEEVRIDGFFLYKSLGEAGLYRDMHENEEYVVRPDRPADLEKWRNDPGSAPHYGLDNEESDRSG